jgi:hypothetical protein
MSITFNDQGKVLVTFNGSVISCTQDPDCPGEALCFRNQSWSAVPSQCSCSLFFLRAGESCSSFDVNRGWAVILIDLLSLFGFGISFFACCSSLYRLNAYVLPKTFGLQKTLVYCARACTIFGFYYGILRFLIDFGHIGYEIVGSSVKTTPQWFKAGFNVGVFFSILSFTEGKYISITYVMGDCQLTFCTIFSFFELVRISGVFKNI